MVKTLCDLYLSDKSHNIKDLSIVVFLNYNIFFAVTRKKCYMKTPLLKLVCNLLCKYTITNIFNFFCYQRINIYFFKI